MASEDKTSSGRSSLIRVLTIVAAVALAAWIGYRFGVQKSSTGDGGGPVPVLRLHGSNTIGKALAPYLAEKFLEKEGATQVHLVPGKEDELAVEGTLRVAPVVQVLCAGY